jgi:hypothetical protein
MKTMKKAKVRFNLGRGKNYMKWKIQHSEGIVYLSPEEFNLKMSNARLRNQKATAKKINEGANKAVCSWILCDEVELVNLQYFGEQIRYNPRVNPFWMDANDNNIDGTTHEVLYTNGRKIFKV